MKEIKGDLLDVKAGFIFQQVNCLGRVGGLAKSIAQKWPDAYRDYRLWCDNWSYALLGDRQVIELPTSTGRLFLVNIFGQGDPGPNTNLNAVDMALGKSSEYVKMYYELSSESKPCIDTYFPYKMGCGLGGADWSSYQNLIDKWFKDAIIVRREGD
jgi:hypothetical protein